MPETTKQQARRIFMVLVDLPDTELASALARACGGNERVRAEVEALLHADRNAAAFLAEPTGAQAPTAPALADPVSTETAGASIGRYKLLEQIGEGGMGTIWMAEQREPVKRRVALKIIKLGMDTKQVIARFEAERQALAMMDHPNIAKVLDAGATDAGRPYFVMEYIKGIPILEYCDHEKVDTKARLELFTSVCHAIQHAHQKGIIHRDIKPDNVLVTLHDGVPVCKVIDFGIAKATNSELTQKTLFTEHRQMIGTPAYMSPEQAEMSGLDIDTRSDIYSLGVLLYELLTGTTPFDIKDLLAKGLAEMMRTIREVEPHKPSTRISTLGHSGARTGTQRCVDIKKLSSLLRGDLDWIVMKCLEKDRTRRYETANGLAADILRHQRNEPITAGAPSAGYRLRKFVRRNRGQVFAGGAVAMALLIGIAAFAWQAHEANHERDVAEEARTAESEQRSRADAARTEAEALAAKAKEQEAEAKKQAAEAATQRNAAVKALGESQALTAFLNDVLGLADPNLTQEPHLTMRNMLDAAAEKVGRALQGQPSAEESVRATIGRAYATIGEPALAAEQLRRALEILDSRGEKSPEVYYSILQPYSEVVSFNDVGGEGVGTIYGRQRNARRAAIRVARPELAASLEKWEEVLDTGNQTEVEDAFRTVLLRTETLGPGDRSLWAMLAEEISFAAGFPGLSSQTTDRGLEYSKVALDFLVDRDRGNLPRTHTLAVRALQRQLDNYVAAKRFPEAETVLRETITRMTATLPETHPEVAFVRCRLADILRELGKLDEAAGLFEENVPLVEDGRFGHARVINQILPEWISLCDARHDAAQGEVLRNKMAAEQVKQTQSPILPAIQLVFGQTKAELIAALEALDRALRESVPTQSRAEAAAAQANFWATMNELHEVPVDQREEHLFFLGLSRSQATRPTLAMTAAASKVLELTRDLQPDDPKAMLVGSFLGYRGTADTTALEESSRLLAEAVRLLSGSNSEQLQFFDCWAAHIDRLRGDFAAAEEYARQGLGLCLLNYGGAHRHTLRQRAMLGLCLRDAGRLEEGEVELRGALDGWLQAAEIREYDTPLFLQTCEAIADTSRADALRKKLAAIWAGNAKTRDLGALRSLLGPTRGGPGGQLDALEALERAIADPAPAAARAVDAALALSRDFQPSDPLGVLVGRFLGDCGIKLAKARDECARLLAEAVRLGRESNVDQLQHYLDFASYIERMREDFGAAEAYARQGVALCLEHYGAERRNTMWHRCMLGWALHGAGRLDEAEVELRAALTWFIAAKGSADNDTIVVRRRLVAVLLDDKRSADAERVISDGLQGLLKSKADANTLNAEAWSAVCIVGLPAGAYQMAVTAIERALQLAPGERNFVNTLGVAQYRVGNHAAALEELARSDRMNQASGGKPDPEDWVFVAMARWQLGQHDDARSVLGRVHSMMHEDPARADDQECLGFLHEAEALIQ